MYNYYEDGEKTGYKCPPKNNQFKKGKSGNPKGRPKKNRHDPIHILTGILQEKITVEENGKKKKINKLEAIYKRLVNAALMGDAKALRVLSGNMEEVSKYIVETQNEVREIIVTYVSPGDKLDD